MGPVAELIEGGRDTGSGEGAPELQDGIFKSPIEVELDREVHIGAAFRHLTSKVSHERPGGGSLARPNGQTPCCLVIERVNSQHRRNRKPGAASATKAKPLGKPGDDRRCTR